MEARVFLEMVDCLGRPIRSSYNRQVWLFLDMLDNILATGGIREHRGG